MNSFIYENKTKVYFGEGVVSKYLKAELEKHGPNVLLAYGGSVIDCCKTVSAQARAEEDIWMMEFTHHRYPTDFVSLGPS